MAKPVLVTITGPSAGGKSHLFNYIRDEAKLPCLISTTTRPPRTGEVEGVDYFFISMEESLRLEKEGQFAELAHYNGHRYGVTKQEFHSKLKEGMAFLVVEPGGIDHYAKPAIDAGAVHVKAYVHTKPEVRLERFKKRCDQDMIKAIAKSDDYVVLRDAVLKAQAVALSRMEQMLGPEMKWYEMHHWDAVVDGEKSAEENLTAIKWHVNRILTAKESSKA